MTEDVVWDIMNQSLDSEHNHILETTGIHHRLKDLWTPERITQGIYTVKLIAPKETCQERSRQRISEPIEAYDLDECYAIDLEEEYQYIAPANLICDVSTTKCIEEVYEQIEQYVLAAERFYAANLLAISNIFGTNQISL